MGGSGVGTRSRARGAAFRRALRGARVLLGLATALGASLALWAAWSLLRLLTRGERREALRVRVVRAWGRSLLGAFGVRLVVEGEPPRGPGILVANHSSYLDVLALCAATGARFVAAAELGRWPLVGPLARSGGTLLLERERKRALVPIAEELCRALLRGELIVLFPEGRSTRGARLHAFRPSLLQPAVRARAPVYAAALHYESSPPDLPAGHLVPWTDGAPFLPHALGLLASGPVRARLRFDPAPVRGLERKQLARACERAVQALFEPLEAAREPDHEAPPRAPG